MLIACSTNPSITLVQNYNQLQSYSFPPRAKLEKLLIKLSTGSIHIIVMIFIIFKSIWFLWYDIHHFQNHNLKSNFKLTPGKWKWRRFLHRIKCFTLFILIILIKMYLSTLHYVFVDITKCIYRHYKMYLSKLKFCPLFI